MDRSSVCKPSILLFIGLTAVVVTLAVSPIWAADEQVVKVGVLHSLTGTMAISEVTVKNATLLAIDEINAKGGVLS